MKRWIKTSLNRYHKNTEGQFSVVFAVLALPLMAVTTFALDHSFAYKEKLKLSNALDDAALASVLNQTLSEAERAKYATNYFWNFFDDSKDIKFEVLESGSDRVSLVAKAIVPTSVSTIFGKDSIIVSENAATELTKGSVVCMLALDPEGAGSFEISEGGHLDAGTCSVQVNSTHEKAAILSGGSTATAKSFCISGGTLVGEGEQGFTPFANTECGSIADPYQYRRIPGPGECIPQEKIDEILSHWHASIFEPFEYEDYSSGRPETIRVEGGVTLQPGTYCGGLKLTSKNVRFEPGTYIMKDGPLFLEHLSKIQGEDVSVVFSGNEATFQMGFGSLVNLKAPAKGDLAGLVLAQHLETQLGKDAALPSGKSVIFNASNLELTGTAYLPHQKIIFHSSGVGDAQAPSTSFIGYQLAISAGANVEVKVDHQKAGLPPILPRSDESARLVE